MSKLHHNAPVVGLAAGFAIGFFVQPSPDLFSSLIWGTLGAIIGLAVGGLFHRARRRS